MIHLCANYVPTFFISVYASSLFNVNFCDSPESVTNAPIFLELVGTAYTVCLTIGWYKMCFSGFKTFYGIGSWSNHYIGGLLELRHYDSKEPTLTLVKLIGRIIRKLIEHIPVRRICWDARLQKLYGNDQTSHLVHRFFLMKSTAFTKCCWNSRTYITHSVLTQLNLNRSAFSNNVCITVQSALLPVFYNQM